MTRLSPALCTNLKYSLISDAIKNVLYIVRPQTLCVAVILWQHGRPPVPRAKGTDTGWDLKLEKRKVIK